MNEHVGYGIIGAGDRGRVILEHLANYHPDVYLRGIHDLNQDLATSLKQEHGTEDTVIHDNYEAMLRDPRVQWVLVCTPNHFHRLHIEAAFAAGKHVFAEKPLATSLEDCLAIDRSHRHSDARLFATGFVLRYAEINRKAKAILQEGLIGKIITVEANEKITPAHSGHIMTCWRRHADLSGGHILEKCCHDLDLLNWFVDALPARVASFGGLDIFTPDNAANLTRFPAPPNTSSVYLGWGSTGRDTQNPFTSDKSIVDNQIAMLEYRNNVRVTFHATMNSTLPERRMHFTGTEGSMLVDMLAGLIQVRRVGYDEPIETYQYPGGIHAGADPIIAQELATSMIEETPPACSGHEGLLSAAVALMIDKARINGTVESLTQLWADLGVDKTT